MAAAEPGAVDLRHALNRLDDKLAVIGERVDDLRVAVVTPAPAPARDDGRLLAALRAESELLTQRVAALAVGVEATRSLLEQHVEDTEQTVGRKAGELGRRLAADFGLRTKGRESPGGRRDPRELNP